MISLILNCFGSATDLFTNAAKSSALPIRCGNLDLVRILSHLSFPIKSFPVVYLGMPLSLRNLTKLELDPLVSKFGNKAGTWKGRLMAKSGRLVLLKTGLSSLAIYMMTIHKLPAWVLKRLTQICRSWLWSGDTTANAGNCRVAWTLICRPKCLVGLGVVDLKKFGRALRIRWLWMAWKHPEWPWVSTPLPCSQEEKEIFAMATEIKIGDGRATNFWQDCWVEGDCPKTIAPSLFKIAARKNRSVWDALKDEKWLQDLSMGLLDDMLHELSQLASRLDRVLLQEGQPDVISWRFSRDRAYSARSAYRLQFEGLELELLLCFAYCYQLKVLLLLLSNRGEHRQLCSYSTRALEMKEKTEGSGASVT
ncbi:hypothetical protein D1007_20501 [Hordeum vulgare]|nr:hypothetical protein D1007_20501 [Hordeum vulgare]